MTNAYGTNLGERSEGASPRLRDELRNELQPKDQEFAADVRRALRDSEAVDAVTAARLSAARHRALSASAGPRLRVRSLSWGLPAALAVALMAWIAVPRLMPAPVSDGPAVNLAMLDALDWATDDPDREIYEDLDLYEALDDAGG